MICLTCNIPCNFVCPHCMEHIESEWHGTENAKEFAKSVTKETREKWTKVFVCQSAIKVHYIMLKNTWWFRFKEIKRLKKAIEYYSNKIDEIT